MKAFFQRYTIPIIVVLLFIVWANFQAVVPADSIHAVDGVADVSDWDLSRPLLFDGEWKYYPNKTASEIDGDGIYVAVPHEWEPSPAYQNKPYGYATYELTVTGLTPQLVYAFYLKDLSSSYNLYVNDVLVMSNGVFATSADAYVPEWMTSTGYFESDESGNIVIVVEIANYSNYRGGFWNPLRFSTGSNIFNEVRSVAIIEAMLFAIFMTLGLFFILFHSLSRKEEKALYFGLFAVLLGVRVLLTGNRLIYAFLPTIPWAYVYQLDYLFGMLLFPVLALLIRRMDFVAVPKIVTRFYIAMAITIVVFGLFFPNQWYRIFFELFRYVILIVAGYLIYQVVQGIKKKRVSAVFMLVSGVLMLFAIIAEFFFAASQFLFVSASLGMVGLMAIMVIDDILFIKQSKQRLETLVIIDPLTNVYNRLYLSRLMESEYTLQKIEHDTYILFIDLNDFKGVNDRFGHLAGDTVLIATAQRLSAIIEPIGEVFRYGGDEFVCIVSLPVGRKIQDLIGAIAKAFQAPVEIASGPLVVSASIGFTPYHQDQESLEAAIHRADTTMYLDKQKQKQSQSSEWTSGTEY